jgi:hypothetical protein
MTKGHVQVFNITKIKKTLNCVNIVLAKLKEEADARLVLTRGLSPTQNSKHSSVTYTTLVKHIAKFFLYSIKVRSAEASRHIRGTPANC